MKDYRNNIRDYIELERGILSKLNIDEINEVINILEDAFSNENTIYIFGNGGSASTASHYQNDFNKSVSEHTEKKFRFCCLNDNLPTVMAIANDIGIEEVFRFQLEGKLKQGDIVMAISGSGNSQNVINAVEYAKKKNNTVIGVTGYDGGRLRELCDYTLHAPVNSMQVTEDIHLIFNHMITSILYRSMCGIDHLKG